MDPFFPAHGHSLPWLIIAFKIKVIFIPQQNIISAFVSSLSVCLSCGLSFCFSFSLALPFSLSPMGNLPLFFNKGLNGGLILVNNDLAVSKTFFFISRT